MTPDLPWWLTGVPPVTYGEALTANLQLTSLVVGLMAAIWIVIWIVRWFTGGGPPRGGMIR